MESDGRGLYRIRRRRSALCGRRRDSIAAGGRGPTAFMGAPVLNVPLIARLRVLLEIPLVLHGASGLTDGAVRDCIQNGIAKVNFATEPGSPIRRPSSDT